MEPTTFSPAQLQDYFAGRKRHADQDRTVTIAKQIGRHVSGTDFGELISERRPSESTEILDYRKKILVPKTKATLSKVFTCLGKIRKSPDWSIRFDQNAKANRIATGEDLETYLMNNFPKFGSITNWTFQLALPKYCSDPNAVCIITPGIIPTDKTKYVRPYPLIIPSCNVVDFVDEVYAIVKSTETCEYKDGNETKTDGVVFYVINTQTIDRWEQTSGDLEKLAMVQSYEHGSTKLPAFKLKGVVVEEKGGTIIYESRLNPMVPSLDEAIREYSDLQVEVIQHIHSTWWSIEAENCTECRGIGSKMAKVGSPVKCEKCGGNGKIPSSPFKSISVQRPKAGENTITPPAGYIQKQVDIVKIQDERVTAHLTNALSAINMEFLAQTPLTQSGEAKKTDRDELNNFVNSIAEDLVAIMDSVAFFINEMRYHVVVTSSIDRQKMLPKINVPDRFDLFGADYLLQELTAARTAKVNPATQTALEIEYSVKKFCTDESVRNYVQAVLELDPLSNVDSDTKLTMMQNKGIREIDYIVSCNIYPFVLRAAQEDKGFFSKKLAEKKKVLENYATEVITANSAAQQALAGIDTAGATAVQDTALNGAQVAAMLSIVNGAIESGTPAEIAEDMLFISFPTADPERIASMVAKIKAAQQEKAKNPPAPPAPPAPPHPPVK